MKMIQSVKRFIIDKNLVRSKLFKKLSDMNHICCFFSKHKFKNYFEKRENLYEFIHENYVGDNKINFLEFGVYKGKSLEYWIEINRKKDSRFYGFDTFEGLPENWNRFISSYNSGHFSTHGKLPSIKDRRVKFIKGLFQDTLDHFIITFSNDKQKVIHLDADLYTSTLFVLTKLDSVINKGDILLFDEFSSGDELRAFDDWTRSYRREYKLIAVAGVSYQQVAFQML